MYGERFVQLLAAAAGYGSTKPDPDHGIDLVITDSRSLPIAVAQVKSWSTPKATGRMWHFPNLTERQFNVIAGKNALPAYLIVVVVPRDRQDYTNVDERQLHARHAAYWVSLANQPRFDNPTNRKVRVDVPQDNLLTVREMITLCGGQFANHRDRRASSITGAS